MSTTTKDVPLAERRAYERARRRLAREIGNRVPQPLDPLEIAAVVESTGITDGVAREDYGVDGVFELADHIFPAVLRASTDRIHLAHTSLGPELQYEGVEQAAALETTGRGLLALAPLAFVLLAIQGLGASGWTTSAVLALSFGVSAGMLLTSGPILAIGRRTGIYLGFGYRASARRFLAFAECATIIACLATAAALFAGLSALGVASAQERLIFAGALAACGVLWLLAASVTLAGRTSAAVSSLAAGLVVGFGAGIARGSFVGLAVGYATSAAMLLIAWRRAYVRDDIRSLQLPAPSLLVLEAIPYLAFGFAFALFLLEPHVLGWLGQTSETRSQALTTFELSMTLALPPVILASGVNDHITRSFWSYSKSRQEHSDAIRFRRDIGKLHRSQLSSYVLTLSAFSCITVMAIELVSLLGGLRSMSQVVFLSGVCAFFLLGIGQFSCLFLLSLSRPQKALLAALAGAITVAAVGVPLSAVDFRLAAPAFVLGTTAFGIAAHASCRRLIGNADYHYAATF